MAVLCSGRVSLSTTRKERSTVAWVDFGDDPSVCVRFTLARLKSIQNRSAAHEA